MSIYDEWKCAIDVNPLSRAARVLFYSEAGDKVRIHRLVDPATSTWRTEEQEIWMTIDKPSFELPKAILPRLLEALTQMGIELPSVSKVEGLYEAQSEHLADLRRLLKLDKRKETA